MGKFCTILVVLAITAMVSSSAARNVPAGLKEEKNIVGFSGIGNNGLPFGGISADNGNGFGGGVAGGLGGTPVGLGGLGGTTGGLGGLGNIGGLGGSTGGLGRLGSIGGLGGLGGSGGGLIPQP